MADAKRSANISKFGKPKLAIEIIAPMMNGQNLHHLLPRKQWQELSKLVIREAGTRCEICDVDVGIRALVCHERWAVYPRKRIQKLVGLQSICVLCHSAVHYKMVSWIPGVTYKKSFDHLCQVNGWTKKKAREYISHVKKLARGLPSNFLYRLDVSYVELYGVRPLARYVTDAEWVVAATEEGARELAIEIPKLTKRHRIALFRNDGAFVAGAILLSRSSIFNHSYRTEFKRLVEALPSLNTSRHKFVGLYGKKDEPHQIYSDALKFVASNLKSVKTPISSPLSLSQGLYKIVYFGAFSALRWSLPVECGQRPGIPRRADICKAPAYS